MAPYQSFLLLIVPAASIGTYLFQKIGPAKSCVFANTVTGAVIISLIFLARLNPTDATYGGFMTFLYVGAPFTFIRFVSSPTPV